MRSVELNCGIHSEECCVTFWTIATKMRTSVLWNEKAAEENINGSAICVGRKIGMEHLKMEVPVSDGILFWFFNHSWRVSQCYIFIHMNSYVFVSNWEKWIGTKTRFLWFRNQLEALGRRGNWLYDRGISKQKPLLQLFCAQGAVEFMPGKGRPWPRKP